MSERKDIERIETEDGHVLVQHMPDDIAFLTIAGSDTSGKARVAFVTLTGKEKEALRRALGKGFLETGR